MKPTCVIYCETKDGDIIRAFTWTRDEKSGIEEARREAAARGVAVTKVWAVPLELEKEATC